MIMEANVLMTGIVKTQEAPTVRGGEAKALYRSLEVAAVPRVVGRGFVSTSKSLWMGMGSDMKWKGAA